jgi:hypothetical protein
MFDQFDPHALAHVLPRFRQKSPDSQFMIGAAAQPPATGQRGMARLKGRLVARGRHLHPLGCNRRGMCQLFTGIPLEG